MTPLQPREAVAQQLDLALSTVEENTDANWRDEALGAVRLVCLSRQTFICDDVWKVGLQSTRNDKALGPVIMAAKRAGWCRKTDRVRPSLRSHLSGKPVWESLIFLGGGEQ